MIILMRLCRCSSLIDIMFSIDLKTAYSRAICNTYPHITRTIAFNGLENVVIKWAFGRAGLLPTITKIANGIHAHTMLYCIFPD